MKAIFIKPELNHYFGCMPLIGMWLAYDYDRAETKEDLAELVHKWLTISEQTTNEVKSEWYSTGAHYLYSILTNKSLDSKTFETI